MPGDLPLEYIYGRRILNLAHRGASKYAPENTLAAFELAAQMGADGVELDVMLTSDGVPVVIHNPKVDDTTDGTGYVSELTLEQIKELDAGSYFGEEFAGEQIPTLDEVFEAIGHRLVVNVELKSKGFRDNGLEHRVVETIRHHGMERHVIVSSFNPFSLRRFRRLAPDIPIGYLVASDQPAYLRKGWLMFGMRYQAHHPEHVMVTPEYMRWARRRKCRVNTWTVDDEDEMARLRDLGVDAIITNVPDVLKSILHGER